LKGSFNIFKASDTWAPLFLDEGYTNSEGNPEDIGRCGHQWNKSLRR
jgi:hypothetical protein